VEQTQDFQFYLGQYKDIFHLAGFLYYNQRGGK